MSELSEGRDASSLCLFYTKKGVYIKNNIRIYEIKSEYIKYLSNYQEHIFDQADGKGNRKYIGIVLEVKGVKYFAPLLKIGAGIFLFRASMKEKIKRGLGISPTSMDRKNDGPVRTCVYMGAMLAVCPIKKKADKKFNSIQREGVAIPFYI